MAGDAQGYVMKWPLVGPFTFFGLGVAAVTCLADQAVKLWLIFAFELGRRGKIVIAPFIDFILIWNTGISYGWFKQEGPVGQAILLGLKTVAVVLLLIWLARAGSRLTALSLGLIVGGALGNALDRLFYGAVADFVLFHITTAQWTFNWYVFNLADAAIVVGVAGILYDSFVKGMPQKRPDQA